MRLGIVVVAGLALLVCAAPMRARASELSWDGPAECAEPDRLLFEIERQLGMPLERAAALQFQVRVESSPSRVSARLRMKGSDPLDDTRERVLIAGSCEKLMETLAVAITLAIGAEGAAPVSAAAPLPRAAASSGPLPSTRHAQSPEDAAASAPEGEAVGPGPEASAFALLVGDVGALPQPALGASLGLLLGWPGVELRGSATLFFDQRTRVEPGVSAGADMSLAIGTLLGCAQVLGARAAALSLPLCAGLDVGRLSAVGRDVTDARHGAMLWLGPRLDAGVSWQVPDTQVRLGAFIGAAAPLNRDTFIVDEIGTVHQPRSVVGRAAVGVELMLQ